MLNLEALTAASFTTDPFPWGYYQDAVDDCDALIDSFPTDGFEWHSQRRILEALGKRGSDAWYQHAVATRPLLELGSDEPHCPSALAEPWLQIADDLSSSAYRERISERTMYDVRDLKMQAHFWRYDPGAFFQPHVDKPHKVVTHLIFLTSQWSEDMGGCFTVLRSGSPDDVYAELPPVVNSSILLRRTDNAWHSVSPIPRDCTRPRLVLQTWFWG